MKEGGKHVREGIIAVWESKNNEVIFFDAYHFQNCILYIHNFLIASHVTVASDANSCAQGPVIFIDDSIEQIITAQQASIMNDIITAPVC